MADKIEIEIELDPKLGPQAKARIKKESGETGKKAGRKFSQEFGGEFKKSSKFLFAGLGVGAIAAVASIRKVISSSKEFVQLAGVQQDAVNELNSALKRTGKFTEEASKDFQAFASQLQNNSVIGDEVILKNAALIQSLGRLSVEGLKGATQAALDMAAVLGIDLTAAATLVGKAAAGEVGSLSRYGVIVKKGANSAETFAKVLKALGVQFGGGALAQTNTFTGALDQLVNTYGDLKELVGEIITSSPTVIRLFKFISSEILKVQSSLKGLTKEGDIAGDLARSFVYVAIKVTDLLKPFEFLINGLSILFLELRIKFKTLETILIGGLQRLGNKLGSIPFLVNNPITRSLKKLNTDVAIELSELQNQYNKDLPKVFETDFSDKALAFANKLKAALAVDLGPTVKKDDGDGGVVPKLSAEDQAALDTLTLFGQKLDLVKVKAQKFAVDWAKVATSIKNNAVQGIGKGVAGGFSAVGAALVKGENALEAFGKAFAAAIGQAAVQLGTRFILEGVAISFNPFLGGPAVGGPLIAAGAALATFGGALGAIAGGGGAAATGVGGGTAVSGGITDDIEEDEAIAEAPDSTQVNVVVQGDVLDSEESGLRIANILNEAFDKQGVVVKGAVA